MCSRIHSLSNCVVYCRFHNMYTLCEIDLLIYSGRRAKAGVLARAHQIFTFIPRLHAISGTLSMRAVPVPSTKNSEAQPTSTGGEKSQPLTYWLRSVEQTQRCFYAVLVRC